MIFYVFLFFLLLVCVYLGQVFGLMIHCELCDEFKDTKRYLYLIPFLRIILFFYCIKKCHTEKDWDFLWTYLLCREKTR